MIDAKCEGRDVTLRDLYPNPLIKDRIAMLLSVVEKADGNAQEAHVVELRLIEEMDAIGQDILQFWSHRSESRNLAKS